MAGLGKHLLVEFYGCSAELLNNTDALGAMALEAVNESGATYLEHHLRKFEPQGVSGVIIIAESHMTFHTWPEYGYMALDYFTCGTYVDPHVAINLLVEKVNPQLVDISKHQRGMQYRDSVFQTAFDNALLGT